jgi:hypothetical protein
MKLNKNILLILIPLAIISCNSGTTTPSVTPTPTPTPVSFCQANINNFSSLDNTSLIGVQTYDTWGPELANLTFPQNLESCTTSIAWNQTRVLAATEYWVSQKLNYCHHHVPTWVPALPDTPNVEASYESCSSNTDVMPPVPTESNIRWNYSGYGAESSGAWSYFNPAVGYNQGNYGIGLDCSDYTKLIYSYAESIIFTSDVSMQAGQSSSQANLAPNMTGFIDSPESDIYGFYSAGNLLCVDGTVAPPRGTANSTSCNGHGGYISVFDSNGTYNESAISDSILSNVLQPGDLIYVAGSASDPYNPESKSVSHVVIWTGQQVNNSNSSIIAPETDIDTYGITHNQCGTPSNPDFWSASNNPNGWIITDSHYQGPDFRVFTYCFYRNQVWGVRRVLQ